MVLRDGAAGDSSQSASARMAALLDQIGLDRMGADRMGEARVSVGELVDGLGDTGLGLTLLLLMLPVLITIPGLPVGTVFGGAVGLLGVQPMAGAQSVRLPELLRLRSMAAPQVRRVLAAATPWLARAERLLRPGRLPALTTPGMLRLLGLVLLLQGLALAVPIPFGNPPPALAVVALGFGLLERDGLAVAVGLVLSLLALIWIAVLLATSAELLTWAAGWLGL